MNEEGKLGSGEYEKRFLAFIEYLNFYKFPLIIAAVGSFLLLISIILLIRSNSSNQEVSFSQEATSSGSFKNKIRIDVEGAVKSAGIYDMGPDSRISDGLKAAGGLSEMADRDWISQNLNLAAKLVDGGKIYIPSVEEKSSVGIKNQESGIKNDQGSNLLGVTIGLININTASQAELEALPGVGPVTAGKIISNRPFQTLEELTGKKAVGKALFEKIKNLISI